ncbi:TPA_asm: PolB [African termite bidnaparvovirus]|nr:TPA_asm: PolB [African termite bidnaparvovirus]
MRLPRKILKQGYFFEQDEEEINKYISECFSKWKTIRIDLHAEILVEFHDQSQIVHGPVLGGLYDYASETDRDAVNHLTSGAYDDWYGENFVGSGARKIGITGWWLNIYRSQEWQAKQENAQGRKLALSGHEFWDWWKSSDIGTDYRGFRKDSFYGCLLRKFVSMPGGRITEATRREATKWLELNIPGYNGEWDVNLSSASKHIQETCKHIPICVFSKRGNIIMSNYERQSTLPVRDVAYLMCDETTNKWKYIPDYAEFRTTKSDRKKDSVVFEHCRECLRSHDPQTSCVRRVAARSEKLQLPQVPNNHRHNLVIYADFEAITPEGQPHIPSGVAAIAVRKSDAAYEDYPNKDITSRRIFGHLVSTWSVAGDNVVGSFFNWLDDLLALYDQRAQAEEIYPGLNCTLCGEPLGDGENFGNDDRRTGSTVKRSYITGRLERYHRDCWVNDHHERAIVYFHNFKSYDSHLLIREFIHRYHGPNVLARGFEKIEQLSGINDNIHKFVIKDSLAHFAPGAKALSKIAKTIKIWSLPIPEVFQTGKDFFPYKWFDKFEKLDEPVPTDSNLWQSGIYDTEIDIEYIKRMIRLQNMTKFRDWHNFYMFKDVCILAQAFENYRTACLEGRDIDPVYFLGAPALSWYIWGREELWRVKLPLDVQMLKTIQEQIRGGVAQCMTRYAVADNENTFMLQFDVNSLYSYCMMQNLPYEFAGELPELPEDWDYLWGSWESEECAFIMGDFELDIDAETDPLYHDLPPMPHKFNGRLITSFLPKEKYLVHSAMLKFWLDHNIKIKKVYWVWVWKTGPIMRNYVERNIQDRIAEVTDEVKKDLYKLLNNALYGKTCENVEKYRTFNVSVLEEPDEEEDGQNNAGGRYRGKIKNSMILEGRDGSDYLIREFERQEVTYNKPNFIGFTILEYAKYWIYKFWYEIKQKFGTDIKLLYTDTDSLLLMWVNLKEAAEFWKEQGLEEEFHPLSIIRKVMPDIWEQLDITSGPYPVLTDPSTKKVAGLWSDDAEGKIITEFVGLKAKTYAIKYGEQEKLRNKGITQDHIIKTLSGTVKRKISFEDYKDVVFNDKTIQVQQRIFLSKDHKVRIKLQTKRALTNQDLKRFVEPNGIDTRPWAIHDFSN